MRSPILLSALLLVCISLVYPFYVQTYLYSNETIGMVSHEYFNYSNSQYELLKVNGKETFLLKKGELVRSSTEISAAINEYYRFKYAPSDVDLENLKASIQGYNDSLNDGARWKGKEEDSCRDLLLLDAMLSKGTTKIYCTETVAGKNNTDCDFIAQVFYYSAPYTEGLRQFMYYNDSLAAFRAFAYSDNEIRLLMANNFDRLANLNENNMKESLLAIKATFSTIKADEAKIESHIFRVPRAGDAADLSLCKTQNRGYGCFGLCPDFNFDDTDLATAQSIIDNITSRIDPFSNRQTIAAALAANTENRLAFRDGEDKAQLYSIQYSDLLKKGDATLAKASEVLSYVNNASYQIKVNQLRDLNIKINTTFNVRNFSTFEDDMVTYANLERIVANQSDDVIQVYFDAQDAKQEINALVFAAQSKGDLSPETNAKLEAALNDSYQLDAKFQKHLTPAEYETLKEGYGNISSSVSQIVAGQNEFIALSKFRGMSRRINNGVYDLAVSSQTLSAADISANAKYFPIGFSVFTWLSLSALALFLFFAVSAFVMRKKGLAGTIVSGASLVLLLGAVLIFSIALYFYLDKTSSNANIEEFIISMNGKQNVSVVLDLRGVPPNAAVNMRSCADLLRGALITNNRSVTMYEMSDVSCVKDGSALAGNTSCGSGPETPEFVLNYSTLSTKPTFSAIFNNKAYLNGDTAYYGSCQIAAVFK